MAYKDNKGVIAGWNGNVVILIGDTILLEVYFLSLCKQRNLLGHKEIHPYLKQCTFSDPHLSNCVTKYCKYK